jgi:phage repressor protein C with HTH and peptisase S24 domain
MPSPAETTIGSRIKAAREEKGVAQAALGRACGVSRAAVSQWEADTSEPSGTNLVRIARFLGVTELWLAEGRGPKARTAYDTPEFLAMTKQDRDQVAMIPEILVQAGMGDSGIPEIETFGSDTVKDNWGLPADYVRGVLNVSLPTNLRVIGLKGDSMSPTLLSTDRAIVDIGDRTPSPPGIFALWDGYGVIVKRIEIVPKSKPPRIKVISDNTLHEPYELGHEDYSIVGRLLGFVRRL